MAAFSAFLLAVVLEKFDTVAAFWAFGFKNIFTEPITAVLSGTLHDVPLFTF
jgi:hypothetical protein